MALIKCPECGQEVSDQAPVCVHCGYPLKQSPTVNGNNGNISQINPNPSAPRCPTCGSTNVEKITNLNRGISVAMWGMMSKKINKSFKCKNCGYTW